MEKTYHLCRRRRWLRQRTHIHGAAKRKEKVVWSYIFYVISLFYFTFYIKIFGNKRTCNWDLCATKAKHKISDLHRT